MIGIVQGIVTKAGEGKYGPWYVVSETVTKQDGDTFEKRYMVSGKTAPAEGQQVVVQGYIRADVDENNGKHYANIKLNGASFTALGEPKADPYSADSLDSDVPF